MADKLPPLPPGFELEPQPSGTSTMPAIPEGFHVMAEDAPTKPSGSTFDYAVDQFKKGLAGTMALPNLAVDATQAALDAGMAVVNKVRGVGATPEEAKKQWFLGNSPDKENLGGYKQTSKAYEALLRGDKLVRGKTDEAFKDVPIPTDSFGGSSKSDKYIGSIANMLGSSLIPGTGPVVQSQRKLLTLGTELAGNVASGMGAVDAAHWFGNLAPQVGLSREQGEALGAAFGGMMGPKLVQLAGQAIAKTSQTAIGALEKADLKNPWDKNAQKDQEKILLNKEIIRGVESNPTSTQNLAELGELQKKMDDFRPGVAQATNSPELIAMTNQVAKSSPEALAAQAAVDARNVAAISKFKEKAFPGSEVALNAGAQAKMNADRGMFLDDLSRTDQQLQALADKYNRNVDKSAIGDELRTLYFSKKGEAREVLNKQIEDVYATANRMEVKADMGLTRDLVRGVIAEDKNAFQQMPSVFNKILGEFGGEAKVAPAVQSRGSAVPIRRQGIQPTPAQETAATEASFEKLHSLYKEANRNWADAVTAQRPDLAQKIDVVRKQLQKQVDTFAGPQYGMLGEKFGQFNQDYSSYAKTFREGAGGQLGKMGKNGMARDAEDIVDKTFLQTGDKAKGLDDFFRVYGNDERAGALLKDGIVDNFSRAAVKSDGTFNAVGARNWLKKNDRAMQELPNLRAELTGVSDTAGMLVNRQRELDAQRKILDRSVMASAAKGQDPQLLIQAGMRDPRMFKALLASSKTQESQASLARAIVNEVVDQSNPMAFLKQHSETLKPVMDKLGKDHWGNLQAIAKAEEIAGRVKVPGQVELGKIQDVGSEALGTSVPSLMAKLQNVKAGRTSDVYQALDIGSRYVYKVRTEELQRLRQAALTDPDVAGVMAKIARTPGGATQQQLLDLKAIAFHHGITIGSRAVQEVSKDSRMTPEERAMQKRNPDEGRGVYRRPESSALYR